MHLTEQAEEILESFWDAREKKTSMREIPNAEVLKELLDGGIIKLDKENKTILTEKGLILARDAVRRHRLAERLLTDVLAVKSSLIHETACQFEHHLHKGIDENVCTLLGHPRFCPHGSEIPAGKCCETNAKEASAVVSTLAAAESGRGGQIAYLHTTDPRRAQMLISMGFVPGTKIKLLASYPSVLLQLGEGQFAVDKETAGEVYVRFF